MRVLFLFCTFALLVALCGCGVSGNTRSGGASPTTSDSQPSQTQTARTFVYVASFNQLVSGAVPGGGISEFSLDSNVSLIRIMGSPFAISTNSQISMAADPKGRFVFASAEDGIRTLAISSSTGLLSEVASVGSGWHSPLVVDSSGEFLYAGVNGGIEVFSIGSAGALTSIQSVDVDPLMVATGLAEDSQRKFLYFTNQLHTVAFGVNNNGTLNLVSSVSAALPGHNGPLGVAPTGKFVYVQSLTRTAVYASNGGTLTLVQTASCSCISDFPGSSVVVHPTSRFLYENVSTPGVVLGFAIANDGTINPLAGSPVSGTGNISAVGLDPSATFAFAPQYNVGNESSLAVFSVDSTSGTLTQLAGSPVPLDVPVPAIATAIVTVRVSP